MPAAPSAMASSSSRSMCADSAGVAGRAAKPMAAMRRVPWPTRPMAFTIGRPAATLAAYWP